MLLLTMMLNAFTTLALWTGCSTLAPLLIFAIFNGLANGSFFVTLPIAVARLVGEKQAVRGISIALTGWFVDNSRFTNIKDMRNRKGPASGKAAGAAVVYQTDARAWEERTFSFANRDKSKHTEMAAIAEGLAIALSQILTLDNEQCTLEEVGMKPQSHQDVPPASCNKTPTA